MKHPFLSMSLMVISSKTLVSGQARSSIRRALGAGSRIIFWSTSVLLKLKNVVADIRKSVDQSRHSRLSFLQKVIRLCKDMLEVSSSGKTFVDECLSLTIVQFEQAKYESNVPLASQEF